MRYLICTILFVVAVSLSYASPILPKAEKDVVPVEDFPDYTWVCYAPTNFNPDLVDYPDEAEITADLEVLNDYVFTGIATYGSEDTLGDIPRLADEVGVDVFIMGIFYYDDVTVQEEIENAIAAAEYVDAYCVGNEGLSDRYTMEQLEELMDLIKTETGRPVTTAEQIEDYLAGDEIAEWLLTHGDWLFPIVHPVNNGIHDPAAGATWTEGQYDQILALADGKLVFVRETGWPTDEAPWATEENQADYFMLLAETDVFFSYFEAFDQYWKNEDSGWDPWEEYYGLFDMYRNPKLFVSDIGVRLTSFEAKPAGGAVAVTWETVEETGLSGYNLYRSEAGERIKLNGDFITGVSPYLYLDPDVTAEVTYEYWLEAVDYSGAAETFGPARVTVPALEWAYGLAAGRPNPTTGAVTFTFTVPDTEEVTLAIYDIAGRRIATLYEGLAEAGETTVTADLSLLAPGVYVYGITAANYREARKLVISSTGM